MLSAKYKVVAIVISIVLLCSAVIGLTTYLVINEINKGKAVTSYTSIGNLLDGNNALNLETYRDLMTALQNDTTSTRNKTQINGGTPLVFKMGEINGRDVNWQVVYQTGDIITVWMTQPYTREYFNYDGRTYSDGIFSGATQTDYDQYGNYSRSTLRQATQRIYTNMSTSFPVITNFIVSPSAALPNPDNEQDAGIDWQREQENGYYWNSAENIWSITNGLESNNLGTSGGSSDYTDRNPYNWTWDSTAYDDMFWIPSYYEVFNDGNGENTNSSGGSNFFNGGLWRLSATDVAFTNTRLDTNATANSYCWLRSGSR